MCAATTRTGPAGGAGADGRGGGLADRVRTALGGGLFDRFSTGAAFRRLARRAEAARLGVRLEPEPWARAEDGRRLLSGRFVSAGVELRATPATVWRVEAGEPTGAEAQAERRIWRVGAHGFEWLADLAALDGARARAAARQSVAAWIAARGDAHDPIVWRPDVASRRLHALLHAGDLLLEPTDGAPPLDAAAFGRTLGLHVEWVAKQAGALPPGLDRLTAAVALESAAAALDGPAADRAAAAANLDAALDDSVGEDGAVVDRAPSSTWRAFALLSHLDAQLGRAGRSRSAATLSALARLGAALRFFRAGDGGLALFHGSSETADGRLDVALAAVKSDRTPPRRLADAGFERVVGGRVTITMDVGAARGPAAERIGHASTLALEISAGRRRLVVNCGSGAHLDDAWARAGRGAAAHSTLIVDGLDGAQRKPIPDGQGGGVAMLGPSGLGVERKEERNGVWLMGAHEGYRASHGLVVTRRLFLSADGGDLRGEDTAQLTPDGRKAFDRQLQKRERKGGGVPVAARFHLHPDVSATVVADGEAITLRLPHGEVWVMRQAGGKLALEDSVYLGRRDEPEATKQIVVSVAARQARTQLRWAFRRVGEVGQLPRDVEALLAEATGRASDADFGVAPPSSRR